MSKHKGRVRIRHELERIAIGTAKWSMRSCVPQVPSRAKACVSLECGPALSPDAYPLLVGMLAYLYTTSEHFAACPLCMLFRLLL